MVRIKHWKLKIISRIGIPTEDQIYLEEHII